MFFVIRHGERADKGDIEEKKLIEIDFDPHLTKFGTIQAFATGEVIKTQINEALSSGLITLPSPKYLILSSPFLRTIQTSYHIAKYLGDDVYNKTIYLHDSICECLDTKNYKFHPLSQLYIKTKTSDDMSKYFDYQIKDDFLPGNIIPDYPEDGVTFPPRIQKAFEYIQDYILKKEEYKNLIVLLITHQAGVEGILEMYKELDKHIYYCSVNQFYFPECKKENCKVLMKGNSDHVYELEKQLLFE